MGTKDSHLPFYDQYNKAPKVVNTYWQTLYVFTNDEYYINKNNYLKGQGEYGRNGESIRRSSGCSRQ